MTRRQGRQEQRGVGYGIGSSMGECLTVNQVMRVQFPPYALTAAKSDSLGVLAMGRFAAGRPTQRRRMVAKKRLTNKEIAEMAKAVWKHGKPAVLPARDWPRLKAELEKQVPKNRRGQRPKEKHG